MFHGVPDYSFSARVQTFDPGAMTGVLKTIIIDFRIYVLKYNGLVDSNSIQFNSALKAALQKYKKF